MNVALCRKRQRLPSNGSIRTDAAIRFPPFHREYCAASLPIECFYEKVVKVKADVAAILNFFSRPQIEADHHDAAPLAPIGGMRKGGTRPPRLSPSGGNGKGGVPTSLLPQAF